MCVCVLEAYSTLHNEHSHPILLGLPFSVHYDYIIMQQRLFISTFTIVYTFQHTWNRRIHGGLVINFLYVQMGIMWLLLFFPLNMIPLMKLPDLGYVFIAKVC